MFAQSLWSLAAAAFFSMMAACVKYCNDVFGPLELVFYRSLFTTLFDFITLSLHGETLKTRYPMLHLRRDVLGFASVAIWFFTLGLLPLGTNITLTYSTPLFLALNFILLALWKKEQPEWPLIGSILLGFVGIVVVMRPSFLSGDALPALLCLFVAFIDLFGYWQIRFLGRVHEPSWRIVFYYSLFCTVGALLGVLFFEDGFHMSNARAAVAAFLVCLLATAGMLASTRAWIGGNMLLVSCLGFSAIPFSELIGIFFFKNIPDTLSLIGMTIVAAAGMIATIYTKKAEKAASVSGQKDS